MNKVFRYDKYTIIISNEDPSKHELKGLRSLCPGKDILEGKSGVTWIEIIGEGIKPRQLEYAFCNLAKRILNDFKLILTEVS